MARGHRLNTSIVLAVVHCLSGLFQVISVVKPSLSSPPPPHPQISNLASVDIKQHGQGRGSHIKNRTRDLCGLRAQEKLEEGGGGGLS